MSLDEIAELSAIVIETVGHIIDTWRNAQSGAIDPAKALAMMQSLRDGVAADRAAVDALMKTKFGVVVV